jgi:hypothetical protein
MEDRTVVAPCERTARLVEPLDREAVGPQRIALRDELCAFSLVRGKAQASDATERVARKRGEPFEVALAQPPERGRRVRPQPLSGHVVGHGASAEGEAAVTAAGTGRELPGFA